MWRRAGIDASATSHGTQVDPLEHSLLASSSHDDQREVLREAWTFEERPNSLQNSKSRSAQMANATSTPILQLLAETLDWVESGCFIKGIAAPPAELLVFRDEFNDARGIQFRHEVGRDLGGGCTVRCSAPPLSPISLRLALAWLLLSKVQSIGELNCPTWESTLRLAQGTGRDRV